MIARSRGGGRSLGAVDREQQVIAAEAPGVRITARSRGAHLMQWTTHGVDRLWLSPLSDIDQAGALRGGVPVLFPQFAAFGPLPKHGFARTADWEPVPVRNPSAERAEVSFQLRDSEATRQLWPHAFEMTLDVRASAEDLTMVLTITNTGREAAHFTAGLHTYLAVSDPQATITGLEGCHEWDGAQTSDPAFSRRIGGPLRALDERDAVIAGAQAPVVLNDDILGSVQVAAEGFAHRVVWNPGPGQQLPDVAPGDESAFVCIEPVSVIPIALSPGAVWEGRQQLFVR